jgi:hypothetical protein
MGSNAEVSVDGPTRLPIQSAWELLRTFFAKAQPPAQLAHPPPALTGNQKACFASSQGFLRQHSVRRREGGTLTWGYSTLTELARDHKWGTCPRSFGTPHR